MLRRVSELLGFGASDTEDNKTNDLQLATAALLVQVSMADGDFSADERASLTACLTDHFAVIPDVATELLDRAERDQSDTTCLYAFTRTIAKELDHEGRQDIVRLLWQVALTDNILDNFEANVVAKVSGLLGVSSADRVRLKQEVAAENTQ